MFAELLPKFEKNILLDNEYRHDLIQSDKQVLRDYINSKIQKEGFQTALDSKVIQQLWNDLTCSVDEDGCIRHRMIGNAYYFRGFTNQSYKKDESKVKLFTFDEYLYLAYGILNSFDTINIVIEKSLSKDKNFIKMPVAPMIFSNFDDDKYYESRILSNFEFNIPDGMTINEYYNKNHGLINDLSEYQIKKGLMDYKEKANDFLSDMYYLLQSYSGSTLGSEAESIEWNNCKVDKIFKVYLKMIFSIDLDSMLSSAVKVEEDETEQETRSFAYNYLSYPFDDENLFNRIFETFKNEQIFDKNGNIVTFSELFEVFLVNANKLDQECLISYSKFNQEFFISKMIELLEKNEIDKIYISNQCFLYHWSKKTKKYILENKNRFVFHNDINIEDLYNNIENALKKEEQDILFEDLRGYTSSRVYYSLIALFDKLFEDYCLSENSDKPVIKEKKDLN